MHRGKDLTRTVFIPKLIELGIPVKEVENRLYKIGDLKALILYSNASFKMENKSFSPYFWGLPYQELSDISIDDPKSLVIFLGGRNLSDSDRLYLIESGEYDFKELPLTCVELVILFRATALLDTLDKKNVEVASDNRYRVTLPISEGDMRMGGEKISIPENIGEFTLLNISQHLVKKLQQEFRYKPNREEVQPRSS